MRLLNSICNVIASSYNGLPIHIEEVPADFERACFYVKQIPSISRLKNINVYQDESYFQIVYFGKRNEANQVITEELYKVKEELKALFLLRLCVPVLPLGNEKARYAKIESYSDELRLDEGCLYVKMLLNFTEDVPRVTTEELVEEIEIDL